MNKPTPKEQDPVIVIFNDIMAYMNYYKELNEEGRRKLMEYASDLVKDKKYTAK
mgnify:CR=1 FL=1